MVVVHRTRAEARANDALPSIAVGLYVSLSGR